MSRGLGQLQQRIIERVSSADQLSFNRLGWELSPTLDTDLAHHYKSFHRAVTTAPGIRVRKAYLQNLAQMREFYPYKTGKVAIRDLRLNLLPTVVKYLAEDNGRDAFSLADNEEFLFSRRARSKRDTARLDWQGLETKLGDVFSAVPSCSRQQIHDLVTRGRQLFVRDSGSMHASSLGQLILNARASLHSVGATALERGLSDFYAQLFPGKWLGATRLKSQLAAVFSFGKSHRTSSMKASFKKVLHQRLPEYIEALPGHRNPSRDFPLDTEFSAQLDQVVQRDVLGPFLFISLRSKRRQSAVSHAGVSL